MSRVQKIDRTPKVSDLLIRQKVEAMIEYAYVAMRQFPKTERHVLSAEIRQTLWQILRLEVNDKTQVFPVSLKHGRALDYLGYRIWPTHRLIRKNSIQRMLRTFRTLSRQFAQGEIGFAPIRQSVASWVGHCAHADTVGLRTWVLGKFVFTKG